jgi:hypothetical protein
MRLLACFLLAVAGCSSADPCDGLAGTCVSARVEGNVMGLDALRISVAGQPMSMTSMAGGTFSLPVRLAIVLPAGVASPASITIDGMAAGQPRASSGAQSVPLVAGGKTSFTFTLAGGPVDGGADGPPPGVVSFFPSTVDYGTIARGTMSPVKTLRLYNNTMQAVSLTNMPTPTGDGDLFNIDPSSTCVTPDAGMNVMLTVPAGGSCSLAFVFQPTRSGQLMTSLTAMFNDGETASFTLKGTATPVWSAETAGNGSTNLTGVWGSGPGDIYAVASVPAGPPIFHTDGKGTWNTWANSTSSLPTALFSISGVDATHFWVGAGGEGIWMGDGSMNWPSYQNPQTGSGNITGLWAQDTMVAYGASNSAMGHIWAHSTSWSAPVTNALQPFNAACGAGQRAFAVGDSAQFYASDANTATAPPSWGAVPGTPFVSYTLSLHGCWASDANNVWVVGVHPTGTAGIYHCVFGTTWACTHETAGNFSQDLNAVSGRVISPGMVELYAVGPLGPQVLHSMGTGTWTQVQVPNNQMMNGVWVSATGEVVAVGSSGGVNHFY